MKELWLRALLAPALCAFVSCGGGGGSGGSADPSVNPGPPNSDAREHMLRFVDRADVELAVGESYSNPQQTWFARDKASDIEYRSSNPAVASVNRYGRVTTLQPGVTVISGIKTAEPGYRETVISYQVTVPDEIRVNVSVGASDSLLALPADAPAFALYRTREGGCDFLNYATCSYGQMDIWNGMTVTDTAAVVGSPAVLGLQLDDIDFGRQWIQPTPMPDRFDFGMVNFNGRLWVIGGWSNSDNWGERRKDIWSSADGAHWIQVNAAPDFSARSGHQVVEFNGRLLLIGGWDGGYRNDVWVSENGSDWSLLTANAAFAGRTSHQVVVYQGRLWLSGGKDIEDKNDVWSSSDGIHWRLETPDAQFPVRYRHQMVVFKDQLWLVGGESHVSDEYDDVWSSLDGINWTQRARLPSNGDPLLDHLWGVTGHQLVVFKDRMWLIAGESDNPIRDIWTSTDGIKWKLARKSPAFSARLGHRVVVFDDRLVLAGGSYPDVWTSDDGLNWRALNERSGLPHYGEKKALVWNDRIRVLSDLGPLFSSYAISNISSFQSLDVWRWRDEGEAFKCWGRYGFGGQIIAFRSQLWSLGGWCHLPETAVESGSNLLSSRDGNNWTVHPQAGFYADDPAVFVFNDQLWLLGGGGIINRDSGTGNTNDIWSSVDGLNWTLRNASPGFPEMDGSQVVEFNDKVWLTGGHTILMAVVDNVYTNSSQQYHPALCSSSDGINWVSHDASVPFGARAWHQMVQFQGQLWLIGGNDAYTSFADIWSSDDGVNWTRRVANAPFGKVHKHQVVALDDKLYLIETDGDVWESPDGLQWRRLLGKTFRVPTQP